MRGQIAHQNARKQGGAGQGASALVKPMPGREKTDAALLQRIAADQDRIALNEIAVHYAPRLKAWLIYRGEQPSTAEDIVQDVIILIWTKARMFDSSRGPFSAWIFRTLRNRWIDHKRKHDRMNPTEPETMFALADAPTESGDLHLQRSEAAQAVQAELANLPVDQKQMLQLAFFEGLSHSEIAERTGLALGTIKSRIRAPLKKLKDKLKDFSGVDQ